MIDNAATNKLDLPSGSPRQMLRAGVEIANLVINPVTLKRTSQHAKLAQRWIGAGPMLSVRREPYAAQGWCYLNVQEHCLRHGGEPVIGWSMHIEPDVFVAAVHHTVWRSPEGELIDIRALDDGDDESAKTTFIVDDGTLEFHAEAPKVGIVWARTKMPRYLPIGKNRAVADRLIASEIEKRAAAQDRLFVPVLPQFSTALIGRDAPFDPDTPSHSAPLEVIAFLRDKLAVLTAELVNIPVAPSAPPRKASKGVVADKAVVTDDFVDNLRTKAAQYARGRRPRPTDVPCAGCTLCCRGFWVPLMPGDNPTLYKTVTINGWQFLKRRPTGECVHLGDKGCKLHGKRPLPISCTSFDCRPMSKNKAYETGPMDETGLFLLSICDRGKDLALQGDQA